MATSDPELPTGLAIELRTAFLDLIENCEEDSFLVIENTQHQFVQFSDPRKGFITMDLPTHSLTPEQAHAAEKMLVQEMGGQILDLGNGHKAFQVKVPADELHPLAVLTARVFHVVYGTALNEPIEFTFG